MSLIIFLIAFILRIIFMSPWLEDWDSVQFTLALNEFSLLKHQPHPPGYPLYILLGKFLNLYFKDPSFSLTFLSVIAGSLSVIPFYFLVKRLTNKKSAMYASLIFISLPVHFILSEIAISNVPGLFFILVSAYLIYSEILSSKKISLAGLISGIFLGVRPTDLPIVAGLLTFLFFKKKKLLYRFSIFLGFLIGISLWLIPTIFITGINEFKYINSETSKYFIWHDMLFGKPFDPWTYINDRLLNLIRLFKIGYTPWFFAISVISTITILTKKSFIKDSAKQFLFVYLISYGIPLIFIYNLELPQYTLPLSIVFSIFVTIFLKNTVPKKLFIPTYIIILITLFKTSLDTLKYQAKTIPPTIEPVLFVKSNYTQENTLLITTYTFRQFQYYAPEYKNFYGGKNAPKNIDSEYVIIDYKGLAREIPSLSNYEIINEKHFGPSKNKFVRLETTTLIILRYKTLEN